jgi:hypothetical protein
MARPKPMPNAATAKQAHGSGVLFANVTDAKPTPAIVPMRMSRAGDQPSRRSMNWANISAAPTMASAMSATLKAPAIGRDGRRKLHETHRRP